MRHGCLISPTATRLAVCAAILLSAQAQAAIVIDGRIDETEWMEARVFDHFVVTQPYTLKEATYPTVARILGTPEGIAIGISVTQPAGVPRLRAQTARDADIPGDRVNVFIDFDADGTVAYNLTIGLSGAVQDATMTRENHYSTDWDGDWEHAVQESEDGWSAEFLLPWSMASMRGSDTATRTVAVLFDRVLGFNTERSASASESFERPRFVSNFTHVDIAQFRDAALHVFPYVSARQDLVGNHFESKAGVDVQWKPSGNFQLVAALNPDFGQVEADQLVVNFDAIETFFSDKRPFFTENQGMFDLPTPNNGSLIYTRRIGGPKDDGSGAAAQIDGALKLTGSSGKLAYGVLGALESDYSNDAGRAFYAQRVTYPVGKATFGYAGTYVDRAQIDRTAMVNAIDLTWRPSDSVQLIAQVMASDVELADTSSRGSGEWFRLNLTPPGALRHELEVSHFGKTLDFNDLGFLPRASYNELEWTTEITQNDFATDSRWRSVFWHFEPQVRFNDDGDRLPTVLYAYRRDNLRSGSTLFYEWQATSPGTDDLITRGNGRIQRPARESVFFEYETPRRGDWITRAGLWHFQEGLHGWANQIELNLSYFISDRLRLNGYLNPRWSQDWLIWQHDNQLASFARRQVQTGLNIDWLPGDRHELRAKLQWLAIDADSATAYRAQPGGQLLATDESINPFNVKNFGLQLRYRWTFARQSDFYVVYSRGGFQRNEHNDDGVLDLLGDATTLRDADQFLVKVRYRF